MTVPGGVPNLPQGALTLDNVASNLQDMSGAAMKSRAVERFPAIMDSSTGLSPALDFTPFGLLTSIFSGVNSLIANADPADITGPEDIPGLLIEFIEGLPVVGQFVDLLEAILGTYDGDDELLLSIQNIFAPIRALLQLFAGILEGEGFPDVGQITDGVNQFFDTIQGVKDSIQDFLNKTWQSLVNDDEGAIDRTADEVADALKNIPVINVLGYGAATLVDTFTDILDNLWSALTRTPGTGKSMADVANAATDTANMADTAVQIGEWNNAVLGLRNNKSLMSGVDETEESTFLLTDLYTGGSDPTYISATAASVPLAFWRATETAKKGFVSWIGKGFASITALYVDIYKFNFTTSEMELVHTSPDQIAAATASWSYLVYNIASESDRIDVVSGDILGFAVRVVGAGTHLIGGKSAGAWLPDHPTVIPSRPAATRTGSGDLAFGSITYSSNVPWFGIGILEGDAPPNYFAPRTTQFSAPGSFTYDIPVWANFVDGVYIGGGGGGGSGSSFGFTGEGGDAGVWEGETLVRGVDFPVDATEITVTVGAGGGGGAYPGPPGNSVGGDGGDTIRAAITSGKSAFTAAGGDGGNTLSAASPGDSPGTFPFSGITYVGGNGGASPAASDGQAGTAPGAGGGAGSGGAFGLAWSGAAGARGGAWMTARQT